MKKIRIISLLTLLIAVGFVLTSTSLQAATVTGKSKKRSTIKIDEGLPGGFIKSAKVCFFNTSGKKVACGRVRKTTSKSAYVKISKKRFRRVRKGYEARLIGGSVPMGSNKISAAKGSTDHRYNVHGAYILSILSPATYNKISYNATADGTTKVASLWNNDGDNSLAFLGFKLGGELGIGKSMAIAFGLRYRSYRELQGQGDYDTSSQEALKNYVQVEESGSAIGLHVDFTYLDIAFSPSFFFRLAGGLDFDMSTVNFDATKMNDDTGTSANLASYSSSLSVLSLRLGVQASYLVVGPLGMFFGINLLVPAAEFGGSASASVDDSSKSLLEGGEDSAEDDLIGAVNHRKNSFGAEMLIGSYIAF